MSSDAWKAATIGDAVEPVSRPERVAPDQTYRLLGVRWYGRGCHLHATAAGASLKTPQLNRVTIGDVTYNKMWVTKGAFAVVGSDCDGLTATNEYPLFAVRRDSATPEYLRWAMTTDAFVRAATDSSRGSTSRRRLNPSDFLMLPVALPPVGEQRKIAAILAAVDSAIEATQAVIDQLQVVKKAMMAELLTRGLPGRHTRFKQTELGEVPEGWEVVLLDTVARRGSGHTPSKSHPEYWNGDIKWVSLQDSKRLDRLYIDDTAAKITPLGIENSSATEHPAETVVLSRDAGVGKSAITTDVMAVSQHFMAWVCGPRLNNHYLYYWLQHMKPEFERIAIGNTIKTIGLPYFKSLRLALPKRDEQDQAARTLAACDHRVFAEEHARNALTRLKAALMSVLLSGEVRVTPGEASA